MAAVELRFVPICVVVVVESAPKTVVAVLPIRVAVVVVGASLLFSARQPQRRINSDKDKQRNFFTGISFNVNEVRF